MNLGLLGIPTREHDAPRFKGRQIFMDGHLILSAPYAGDDEDQVVTPGGGLHSLFVGNGGQFLRHADNNLEGWFNTGCGFRSLTYITTGSYNSAFGFEALERITTGSFNTACGEAAMTYMATGTGNTALGLKAFKGIKDSTTGDYNTVIGYQAGYNALAGNNNVIIGKDAAFAFNGASNNIIIGFEAGYDITSGDNNLFIGNEAGKGITVGSGNTVIGPVEFGVDVSDSLYIACGTTPVNRIIADSTSTRLRNAAGTALVRAGNSDGEIGSLTGVATNATAGFATGPAMAGAASGTPAAAASGLAQFCWDSTNKNWQVYDQPTSAWFKVPGLQSGSWTPVLEASSTSGTHTYSIQVGRYIRLGDLVIVWGAIQLSAKDGTMSGNVRITGLPFTTSNISNLRFSAALTDVGNVDFSTGYTQLEASAGGNLSLLNVYQAGDNVALQALTAAGITSTSNFNLCLTYRTG